MREPTSKYAKSQSKLKKKTQIKQNFIQEKKNQKNLL